MQTATLGLTIDNTQAVEKLNAVAEAAQRATDAIKALDMALKALHAPAMINVEVRDPSPEFHRFRA